MTTIAPITASDYADWLTMWHAYLTFYETELDQSTTVSTFARITSGHPVIHGAIARDDDGVALGIVHWLVHPSTWAEANYCYLEDLFVTPQARGAGVGGALIEYVRSWAADNSLAQVYWLTAESNTTARKLYDRVAERSGLIHYQVEL